MSASASSSHVRRCDNACPLSKHSPKYARRTRALRGVPAARTCCERSHIQRAGAGVQRLIRAENVLFAERVTSARRPLAADVDAYPQLEQRHNMNRKLATTALLISALTL